jgi:ATP-dependent DNA helicase RecQ
MLKEFHAAYILDSVKQVIFGGDESKTWRKRLKNLSSFILAADLPKNESKEVDPILAVMDNLISRGQPALASCYVEERMAEALGLTQYQTSEGAGSIQYPLINSDCAEWFERAFSIVDPRVRPTDDPLPNGSPYLQPESSAEEEFRRSVAPKMIGDFVFQLLELQRPFPSLLSQDDQTDTTFAEQRVDFSVELSQHKGRRSCIVIEIDGKEHEEEGQRLLDQRRDQACRAAGAQAVRLKPHEFNNGSNDTISRFFVHPEIKRIAKNFNEPIWNDPDGLNTLQLALCPLAIARLQKTLIQLLINGVLRLEDAVWRLAIIERDVPCARLAIEDLKDWFHHLFALEGKERQLPEIELRVFHTAEFFNCTLGENSEVYSDQVDPFNADVLLDISVLQRPGYSEPGPGFLNRGTVAHVAVIRSAHSSVNKRRITCGAPIRYALPEEHKEQALTFMLRNLFRKTSFREKQKDIVSRTLQQQDVIALLPTGAGKSLTYQLSVLLQPGIALIVDPLKSLMKDQNDNLQNAGIDSTVFINSSLSTKEREKAMKGMARGEFQFVFVSPERLQIEAFREHMAEMNNYVFSYCVVDEAHCVSEWGHDFRPAYLRLGANARQFCPTHPSITSLPIIALTGTASFDVLADVQRELEISADDAIISPEKFEREELQFKVIEVDAPEIADQDPFKIRNAVALAKQDKLIHSLNAMENPEANGGDKTSESFFALNGVETNAGIVFAPHVGGEFGVRTLTRVVTDKLPALVGVTKYYAGSDEDLDDAALNEVQQQFKEDKISLLVATKAFGMGIDKPNVRYTTHFNMPSSIEAFYQEAGRAGRDRKKAVCQLLYCPQTKEVKNGNSVTVDQDLLLFFHDNAFKGEEKEKYHLHELLKEIRFPDGQVGNGIIPRLENLPVGETATIIISFQNDCIATLTNYLQEHVNKNFDKRMVENAALFTSNVGEFIRRLRSEFNKARGEYPTAYGQLERYESALRPEYMKIRNQLDTLKSVYRLSVIGVITDYTVNYRAEQIKATIYKRTDEDYIRLLQDYIGRYVSQQDKLRIPDDIRSSRGENTIQRCLHQLVAFVYSMIEKKRRQALISMEDAAREGLIGDDAFARLINTYFDSRYTEPLRPYLRDYTLDVLWKFIEDTQGEIDALNHLRGACDRLLNENPDNAVLQLLRLFARMLLAAGENTNEIDGLESGWTLLRQQLEMDRVTYAASVGRFYRLAVSYDERVKPVLDRWILRIHAQWLKDFNSQFLRGLDHGRDN